MFYNKNILRFLKVSFYISIGGSENMSKHCIYGSKTTHCITEAIFIVIGIGAYIALGALGTIGIAILLLWIVHNYKYEKCEDLYELYDIVNKEHIALIRSKRSLRKGEIICCETIGDWYIEEVSIVVKPLYEKTPTQILTHDKEYTSCLLKCRRINDLSPEKLLNEEQIEKVPEE